MLFVVLIVTLAALGWTAFKLHTDGLKDAFTQGYTGWRGIVALWALAATCWLLYGLSWIACGNC